MLGIDMLGVDARHASVDGRIVLDGTAQPGAAAGAPEQTAKATPNKTFRLESSYWASTCWASTSDM